jgi:hypothetical protein
MTKEPKLERAQRLLPEWKEYDLETRKLYEEWRATKVAKPTTASSAASETTLERDEL